MRSPRASERRRLYDVWRRMVARCHDPEDSHYPDYGARGIYVCERWRWATTKEQNRNQRDSKILEFRGERRTQGEWAELTGLPPQRIYQRLRRGWSVERALTEAPRRRNGASDAAR